MITQEHRDWVEKVLAEYDVPPLPDDVERGHHLLGWTDATARPQLDVALQHSPSLLVNALGPPPKDIVDTAHEHGIKVAALASNVQHAQKHMNIGVDIIVAQGTEAGGHTGEISSMVLWPEVIEAMPDTPVLAAGGIGKGSQIASALAMGAQGAWTGSIWLTVRRERHGADGRREDARRAVVADRALARVERQARASAAHRVDRRVGARRLPRLPPDADAVHARVRRAQPHRPRAAARARRACRSVRSSA